MQFVLFWILILCFLQQSRRIWAALLVETLELEKRNTSVSHTEWVLLHKPMFYLALIVGAVLFAIQKEIDRRNGKI